MKNRLKSFAWRMGMMLVATAVAWIVAPGNLDILVLPDWAVVGIGLFFGEISKWLNTKAVPKAQ